jgi:type I restriction enzyme S subunit
MKPYLKYKDSGIEWIGEIPEHWEVTKLKYSDKVIMGQSPNSDDYNDTNEGLPFLQGNADFKTLFPKPKVWCETANKIAEKEDVLLSVRAPIGAVNIADQSYGIGRGLCAIRSKKSLAKLLFYLALSLNDELNSIGTGSTYTAVSIDDIANVFIPNKEQRAAIINHAVTKGLNPDVKLKDSGIEWLGEIPEHWDVKKGKYLFSIVNGYPPEQINFAEDGQHTYFRVDDLNEDGHGLYLTNGKAKFILGSTALYQKNLILFPKRGVAILTNKVKITAIQNLFDTNLMGLKVFRNKADIEFLSYCLLTRRLNDIADTSTIPQINNKHIYPLFFPLPPLIEQKSISTFLNQYIHKTALISEVVTGKIDVKDSGIQEVIHS